MHKIDITRTCTRHVYIIPLVRSCVFCVLFSMQLVIKLCFQAVVKSEQCSNYWCVDCLKSQIRTRKDGFLRCGDSKCTSTTTMQYVNRFLTTCKTYGSLASIDNMYERLSNVRRLSLQNQNPLWYLNEILNIS